MQSTKAGEIELLPFTVDVAGSERHDGERGYTYVVLAPSAEVAQKAVLAYFAAQEDDDDVIHERTVPGVPTTANEPPNVWNDLRNDPEFARYLAAAAS